jgi:PIN domain
MIHVLLDTTAFRQDPQRKKAPFQVLRDLAKSGRLTLHIPYMVQNEFIGHLQDEYLSDLTNLTSALSKLDRKSLPKSIAKSIKSFQRKAKTYNTRLCSHVEGQFLTWSAAIGAKVYPLKTSQARQVFENYFSGSPPFGNRRERNHIPDAFILEEALAHSKRLGQLNIITGDEKLFGACEGVSTLTPYRTLEDYIRSEQCQALLRDDALVQHLPNIRASLPQSEQSLKNQLSNKLVDALAWKEEVKDERIPSDDHTASISMVDEAEQISFDFAAMQYLGGGQLLLPFMCRVEVYLDYPIFKSDYHLMNEEEASAISVSEYGSRHYLEAEEVRIVEVKGIISIGLDLKMVPEGETVLDQLDNLVEDADVEVNSIEEVILAN